MVDGKLFKEIIRKGAMMLFCEMTWVLSETLTTAIYNGRGGADVVSGMASSFAIANLFFVAFGGIYSATTVIIGKTLGEGNLEKARREKTWLLSGAIVFGVAMTFVGFATTLIIPVVFGKLSPSAIAISRRCYCNFKEHGNTYGILYACMGTCKRTAGHCKIRWRYEDGRICRCRNNNSGHASYAFPACKIYRYRPGTDVPLRKASGYCQDRYIPFLAKERALA